MPANRISKIRPPESNETYELYGKNVRDISWADYQRLSYEEKHADIAYHIHDVPSSETSPTRTLSGDVVTITDLDGNEFESLKIEVTPSRDGSGHASMENLRYFMPYTGLNIIVSPTLNAQDGTTHSISWQTEAGDIYGGYYDALNKIVVKRYVKLRMSNLTFSEEGSTDEYTQYVAPRLNQMSTSGYLLSEAFEYSSEPDEWTFSYGLMPDRIRSRLQFRTPKDYYSSVEEFSEAIADICILFANTSGSPAYSLQNADDITPLQGTTNIWSNIGPIIECIYTPNLRTQIRYNDNVYSLGGYAANAGKVNGHTVEADVPSTATFSDFTGATSQAAGSRGLVPAPGIGDDGKVLYGDGTWKPPSGGSGNVDDVYVNGSSVLDTNHIAQITNYRVLTRSEYDALSASKLTDGILYCISDEGIVEGDKFAPIIYSLEEREVGTWIDGKPLYQKTYANITFPNNDNFVTIDSEFSTSIYEIKEFKTNGFVVNGGGYVNQRYYILQASDRFMRISHNGNNLQACINGPYTTETTRSNCDITILYTKTTDTPGSGKYNSLGVPTHHYDGNEKIIGTWFGKTLYEKTWQGTIPAWDSSKWGCVIGTGFTDYDEIVDIRGSLKGTAKAYGTLNGLEENGWRGNVHVTVAGEVMLYAHNSGDVALLVGGKAIITIQYTKSS